MRPDRLLQSYHGVNHFSVYLRPFLLGGSIVAAFDDVLESAGAFSVEAFPGERSAKLCLNLGSSRLQFVEDAFVFCCLSAINVELSDRVVLNNDVVEAQSSNTGARAQSMMDTRFDVGMVCLSQLCGPYETLQKAEANVESLRTLFAPLLTLLPKLDLVVFGLGQRDEMLDIDQLFSAVLVRTHPDAANVDFAFPEPEHCCGQLLAEVLGDQ